MALIDASLSLIVWFCEDGTIECASAASGNEPVKIANARSGAYLKKGAMFHINTERIAQFIPGCMKELLPDNLAISMKGNAFNLPKAGKVKFLKGTTEPDPKFLGENPSALKLTYKIKDCMFTGSFKAYALSGKKLKATNVKVAGVVLGGVGYGTATVGKSGSLKITIE